MSEINLGNIEDVIGFDDYIDKRLAEKQKIIDEQQATITELERKLKKYAKIGEEQLKQIIKLQEENEQLGKELDRYKVVILQFVLLLVENGIMDSSVKEEVGGLLEELSGDGV